MTAPLTVMITIGIRHQNPMVLCQLKSRARPVVVRRNHTIGFRRWSVNCFGHQMYSPVTARTRNARLLMPVADRPVARYSPVAPMYRCQLVIDWKNWVVRAEPGPRMAPV